MSKIHFFFLFTTKSLVSTLFLLSCALKANFYWRRNKKDKQTRRSDVNHGVDTAHYTEINALLVLRFSNGYQQQHQERRRRLRDQIGRLRLGATVAEAAEDVVRGRDRGRFRTVPAHAVRRADPGERGVPGRNAGHRSAGRVRRPRARGRVLAPAARRLAATAATGPTAVTAVSHRVGQDHVPERDGQPRGRGPGTGTGGRRRAAGAGRVRAARDRAARGPVARHRTAAVGPVVQRPGARGPRRHAPSPGRQPALAARVLRPAARGQSVLRAGRGRRARVGPRPGHVAPSHHVGHHRQPRGRDTIRRAVAVLGAVRPARARRPVALPAGMRGRRVRGPTRGHGPVVALAGAARQPRGRGRRPIAGVHGRGQAAEWSSTDRVELG